MATLRIGHYPINNKTAEHTYAKMQHAGDEYRFQCYGGTSDSGNEYPVNFYKFVNIFRKRQAGRTDKTELSCNPAAVILLAQWGGSVDFGRRDYDRRSGGTTGLGDCSGHVYALSGVCHQMCNVILCATNESNPGDALLNWPPSFSASRILYGSRGGRVHENAAGEIIRSARRIFSSAEMDDLDESVDFSPMSEVFSGVNEMLLGDLRITLADGHTEERRLEIVGEMLPSETNGIDVVSSIFEVDSVVMNEKNELDNLLIRGQVSHEEYANNVNQRTRDLLSRYEEVLGEDQFRENFEASSDEIDCNVVDVDMMPDYEPIKEALGL